VQNEFGWNWYFPREYLPAALILSLLSVWVLVALCCYLNWYTRRRYFSIWTAAWLFYALWLTLSLRLQNLPAQPWLIMLKDWCVGAAAVFLLWGSARFLKQRSRQTLMGLFLVFLLVWSFFSASNFTRSLAAQAPVFILLGLASVFTSVCFYRLRKQREFMGAGLLAFGFFLWGLYLMAYPVLQSSDDLLSAGYLISAVIQLFIAVSMIIVVLEEARATKTFCLQQIHSHKSEKASLRTEINSGEERFRLLFDQASEGIIITTTDELRILDLNQTAQRWLLLAPDAKAFPTLPALFQCAAGMPHNQATGADWFAWIGQQRQLNLSLPDGISIPVEIHGAPAFCNGRPVYQFFLREVTERTRLELQLRQTEKLTAMGRMIAGIAHELNNPLAAIQGYLELILSRHELKPNTRVDLERVAQASTRAAKLVSNFLTFSGQQPHHRQPVDMNRLIRRVTELRQAEFLAAGVELQLELDPCLPEVQADPQQMQQVLANLAVNAVQAMAGQPPPHRLQIQSRRNEDRIQIVLQDNGPGIDQELVPHIFEPFFTTKDVGSGIGLGLSVAHSILCDHQGRLDYQPVREGGARFVIELPLSVPGAAQTESAAGRPTDAASPGQAGSNPARILVLDDEPAIVELLGESLSALGYLPTLCSSAPQALQLIEQQHFDVILSDLRMPVMDGRQFYTLAVQRKPELACRFIFLTGDVVNGEVQTFLQSTQAFHLTKPFRLAEVENAVTEKLKDLF